MRSRAHRFHSYRPAILGGRRVAATSTPLTILGSALKGWWDFSDASSLFQLSNGTTAVSADTNPIGYATDKSGTGNHVIQATAGSRPLYTVNQQNGRAVARFDGTDDVLARVVAQNQPCTVFVVFKMTTNQNAAAEYIIGSSAASLIVPLYEFAPTATTYGSFAGTEVPFGTADTTFHVAAITMNGASSVMRIDATVVTPVTHDVGAAAFATFTIGARDDGANPKDCDVGEVILADGALSAALVAEIESYLNTRWAVY